MLDVIIGLICIFLAISIFDSLREKPYIDTDDDSDYMDRNDPDPIQHD